MNQGCILPSCRRAIAALLLLGAALVLTSCEGFKDDGFAPACPLGVGRGMWDVGFVEGRDPGPGSIEGRKLLENPNFGATAEAAGDLEAGIVDQRLIGALGVLTREHRICVDAFKEGHYFLPGVPDGPRIPKGYGKAGGLPNTHYYGRAADIWWVDGKPVEGNATDPAVLEVGKTLAGLQPERRPDQIIGPPGWTGTLGYGREEGWISAPDQLELHKDHIHIGYIEEKGPNAR